MLIERAWAEAIQLNEQAHRHVQKVKKQAMGRKVRMLLGHEQTLDC